VAKRDAWTGTTTTTATAAQRQRGRRFRHCKNDVCNELVPVFFYINEHFPKYYKRFLRDF